ncbi:MAG TPA: hypothetical protein VG248_03865 [Caulobacteraceae bacterium]|jgi:hypothetical protein|nr:hypothetical protein [Caulobacteraceae bacterium]
MEKVWAGARALAVVVAIVGAFVTVPYIGVLLLVLGGFAAIGSTAENSMRVYLIAAVLVLGSKELAVIPAVGTYLASIFGSIGTAAVGASVVSIAIGLYRLTMAEFAPKT